jgi:5-methylcytosine-specific restriction endonuclease McrBC regulatory subunit McrC
MSTICDKIWGDSAYILLDLIYILAKCICILIDMSTIFRDFLYVLVKKKFCPHAHRFYPQKNPHPVDKDVDNL